MFIPSVQGAVASTGATAAPTTSGRAVKITRHLLFGSLSAVQSTIELPYKLKYAEPNDWSQPISTGRPNEMMAILTRRITLS